MKYVLLAVLNSLLMALGQVLWKSGMRDVRIETIWDLGRAVFSPLIIAGLFVYGMTMFLWLYILNRADISHVYPIQSLAFVYVLLISSVLFREVLTVNRIVGVAIICIGAWVVSLR